MAQPTCNQATSGVQTAWETRVGTTTVRLTVNDLPATVVHASVGAATDVIMALVGGTGSGKSTQLQHMCNALMGVKDAAEFVHYVSIRHSLHSDTSRSYIITVEVVDSRTQRLQRRYVILDTPGLGDTRGRLVDMEHTTDILQAILRLHHLNAILFLASASESRYTTHQEYCIQSILSFFPGTFKGRVGLVLTNSVGEPNFRFEQTPLRQWQPAVFLVNNAIKPHYTTDDGAEVARQSWPATRTRLGSLLSWVEAQPPAQVTKFADIQQRREKIAGTIDNTLEEISKLSELTQQVSISDKKIGSLQSGKQRVGPLQRKVTHRVYKNVPCDYWSTWCRQHPINEQNRRQACHEHCQLDYNPEGGDVFKGCAAMRGTENCGSCECGWQVHFHSKTTWVAEEVEREEVDKVVEDKLRELSQLITAEEAAKLQRMSLAQKMEALIEVNMRKVLEAAGELVTLCNGFNLAQDLSNQIKGLQLRIDCSVDMALRRKLEETRDALAQLQHMAAATAQRASASDPNTVSSRSTANNRSREGRLGGAVSSGLQGLSAFFGSGRGRSDDTVSSQPPATAQVDVDHGSSRVGAAQQHITPPVQDHVDDEQASTQSDSDYAMIDRQAAE